MLASAENAVSESIKALLAGLETLVEKNRTTLAQEESKHSELSTRKSAIDVKKRDVEDMILKGLNSAEASPVTPGVPGSDPRPNGGEVQRDSVSLDPERPDVEELTPPPPEALTPKEEPPFQSQADEADYEPPITNTNSFIQSHPAPLPVAGSDLLSSLTSTPLGGYSRSPGSNVPKKRKLEDEDAVFGGGGDAMADLDEDVAELLRAESGGR